MATIFVENARIGMMIEKDVFTGNGVKLLTAGIVLSKKQINMLINHQVGLIEVDEEAAQTGAGLLSGKERAIRESLRKINLFSQLDDEHMALLMDCIEIEKRPADTVLFHEKQPGDTFFVILQGSIKIYTKSKKGFEKILTVCQAGDGFGELSMLDGKPRSASAQTLEETEMAIISREDFIRVLQNNFDMTRKIMVEMTQRISDTRQHLNDLKFQDARTRVIRCLLKLSTRLGKRVGLTVHVETPLDLGELAQMAGVEFMELEEVLIDLEEKKLLKMKMNGFEMNLMKLRGINR